MRPSHLIVRGQRVSNRSQRRYLAVAVRPKPVQTDEGTYVAFADIRKRSDNLATVRADQRRYGYQAHGCFVVVVDTETGEEV